MNSFVELLENMWYISTNWYDHYVGDFYGISDLWNILNK